MLTRQQIADSNKNIPDNLIAVFVGATSGIGKYTLKEFTKNSPNSTVIFIGRRQDEADEIINDVKTISPSISITFIPSDISLIKNVDAVCKQISKLVPRIDILVMTMGTLVMNTFTSESLHFATAVTYYSKARFIENLLSLLTCSPSPRVLCTFAGTKEGLVDTTDFPGLSIGLLAGRGHLSSMITLMLIHYHSMAPNVTFIHNFPGPVKTNLGKDTTGLFWTLFIGFFKLIGPLISIPNQESGARHLHLVTNFQLPSTSLSIPPGVYSVDENLESASPATISLIQSLVKDGTLEKLMQHTRQEFSRITNE